MKSKLDSHGRLLPAHRPRRRRSREEHRRRPACALRARAHGAGRAVARRDAGAQRVGHHARAPRARRGDPQGRGRIRASGPRRSCEQAAPVGAAVREDFREEPADELPPPVVTPRKVAQMPRAARDPRVRAPPPARRRAALRRAGRRSIPAAEPAPPEPPRNSGRPRTTPDQRSLLDSGLKDFRNVVSEADGLGGASARAAKSARDSFAAVPSPAPDFERPQPRVVGDRPPRVQADRQAPRVAEDRQPPRAPRTGSRSSNASRNRAIPFWRSTISPSR